MMTAHWNSRTQIFASGEFIFTCPGGPPAESVRDLCKQFGGQATIKRRIEMSTQIARSQKPGLLKKTGWSIMLFLAVLVALYASAYLTLNPEVFFPEQKMVYMAHLTMLIIHIVASMLAILIGPFQFLPGIRKGRWLKVHRWLGRTYLLSILFGGLSGLYMAQFAYGGLITELGFATLAVLWLYSGFMAYRHIRNKDLQQHREWMTRNYALTFAGVMLRVWSPLSDAVGIDFLMAYRAIGWLCWVPNLLVAEWIIRGSRRSSQRARLTDTTVSVQKTAQTDS